MPKTVNILGVGNVQFPDAMSEDQISDAIKTKILPARQKEQQAEQQRQQAQKQKEQQSQNIQLGLQAGLGALAANIPGLGWLATPKPVSPEAAAMARSPQAMRDKQGRVIQPKPGSALTSPLTTGAAKGAMSTGIHAADIGRKAVGAKPLLAQPDVREAITPQGVGEKVGFGGEQAAELLLPLPLPARAERLLNVARIPATASRLARTGNLALRMGTGAVREGLDIGLKTAAQTGSVEEGRKAAQLGGAFGAAAPLVGEAGAAATWAQNLFRKSGEKTMAQVFAPGTKADKFVTANKLLTSEGQDLLNRRVMAFTESGLRKQVAGRLAASEIALEDAWQALGPNRQTSLLPVLSDLQKSAIERATEVVGPGQMATPGLGNRRILDPELYEAYQDLAFDVIDRLAPVGDQVSFQSLRKLREVLDGAVEESFKGKELTNARKQATRAAANSIRDLINKQNPSIAAVNSEYSFWRTANDVLAHTELRRVGQQGALRFLAGVSGRAAGAMLGGHYGGLEAGILGMEAGNMAVKGLDAAFRSTAWRTVKAVTKADIARLLAEGKLEQAADLAGRAVARSQAGGGGAPTSPASPAAPATTAVPARPAAQDRTSPFGSRAAAPAAAPATAIPRAQERPGPRAGVEQFQPYFEDFGRVYGVPPALLRTVARLESGGNPQAVSRAGAQGLMQFMPATAEAFGVRDPFDAVQSIRGAAQFLGRLMRKYDGDVEKVLAAYNAGETRVDRHQGVPPLRETRDYVRRGLRMMGRDNTASASLAY